MLLFRFAAILLLVCFALSAQSNQTPVILISVDTLRADHLGAYGYTKIHTPTLDSFAQGGTRFAAIDSQIPLTLPSHTSLFTSTYPFENGVEENAEIVPAGLITLASILQSHGYRTGAFLGSDLLSQRFGLNRGFEVYDAPFHAPAGDLQNPYAVRVRRDAALVVRSASQWLSAPSKQPPLLFLHLFDLHTPYSVPSPNRIQPNATGYDAEIEYVDRVLGRFREMLIQKGWWGRSLVILLADHGESLGEHGETSHGYFIYQSTLWVPLLIHWPANAQNYPAVVTDPGSLIDVAPTILDFLHIEQPAAFRGTSLLKPSNTRRVYSESMYAHDAFLWSPLRSLRVGNFQYIDAPTAELYSLKSDPGELKNSIRAEFSEAHELRDSLRRLLSRDSIQRQHAAPENSPASMATLRSLGYVAGGSQHTTATAAGSGPDPKDRLPEYQAYERGLEALYDHRESQAVAIFREILEHDASNTITRYYLGEAYLRLHDPDNALREWKTALTRDPSYTPAADAIRELTAAH